MAMLDGAAVVLPAMVETTVPEFDSTLRVPLPLVIQTLSLPSIASAVADAIPEWLTLKTPASVNCDTPLPFVLIDHTYPFASTAAPMPPPVAAPDAGPPLSYTDVTLPPLFVRNISWLITVNGVVTELAV